MKAILVDEPGDVDRLRLAEVDDPAPRAGDVLVRVHATALNRADILQRMGSYPPQHGASPILGLELAGEVVATGETVTQFKPGDRVYGLSGGGGYAELATIHESLTMPVPDSLDYLQAASIPEVFFTAHTALQTLGRLAAGERALIHAGGSGVGIAAIQIAKALGAEVHITAGDDEKCRRARDLGADVAIDYQSGDFAAVVRERTDGDGVHVILDVVGKDYWERNLRSLAEGGRLVLVGLLSGARIDCNLADILRRRLQVMGTVMRSRPLADRAEITRRYRQDVEPLIVRGRIKPVIDRVFPLREAADAHRYMEANQNFGKIVLDVATGV